MTTALFTLSGLAALLTIAIETRRAIRPDSTVRRLLRNNRYDV